MAVAGLRVAANEDLVARFQEEHLRPNPAPLEGPAHRAEGQRRVARPNVEDDGDLGKSLRVAGHKLGEVGQQIARQIVNAGVPEVLEQLGRGGLAGAGETAQDDDVLFFGRLRQRLRVPGCVGPCGPFGRAHRVGHGGRIGCGTRGRQRPPSLTSWIESS